MKVMLHLVLNFVFFSLFSSQLLVTSNSSSLPIHPQYLWCWGLQLHIFRALSTDSGLHHPQHVSRGPAPGPPTLHPRPTDLTHPFPRCQPSATLAQPCDHQFVLQAYLQTHPQVRGKKDIPLLPSYFIE